MANIVYNDLKKSPFKVDYEGFELYFSSAFHKNKFNKNVKILSTLLPVRH